MLPVSHVADQAGLGNALPEDHYIALWTKHRLAELVRGFGLSDDGQCHTLNACTCNTQHAQHATILKSGSAMQMLEDCPEHYGLLFGPFNMYSHICALSHNASTLQQLTWACPIC